MAGRVFYIDPLNGSTAYDGTTSADNISGTAGPFGSLYDVLWGGDADPSVYGGSGDTYYLVASTGDVGATGEIGSTGPTGPSGPSKYVAGFLYDGRGSNVATGTKTNVVRPVEQDSTVSDIHIRLSSGASGGSVTGYIYKVDSSYINASGASFDTDKVTVGEISISDGIYGATGATLSAPGLSAGDFLFGGVTGAGLTEIVQLFVNYGV